MQFNVVIDYSTSYRTAHLNAVLVSSLADINSFGFLQMQALRIRSRNVSAAQKRSKSSNSSFPKQLPMLGCKRQNVLNPC